jgi:hypothetical protein
VSVSAREALGVRPVFPGCLLWARVLLQQLALIRKTKKLLPGVRAPVLQIFSRADETTSFASKAAFEKLLPVPPRSIVLKNSLHAYYT